MQNNQIIKLEYINKLKSEVNRLNEENKRLKQIFLFDCKKENTLFLQLKMEIDNLKKELTQARKQSAMLVLMK